VDHAPKWNVEITLLFSWALNFAIDNLSDFRERLGRGWKGIRSGQFQPVLVEYGHDETDLARKIEPMKIIGFRSEDHGSSVWHFRREAVHVAVSSTCPKKVLADSLRSFSLASRSSNACDNISFAGGGLIGFDIGATK